MIRAAILSGMLVASPVAAIRVITATSSTALASDSYYQSVGRAPGALTVAGETFTALGDGVLRNFTFKLGAGTPGNFALELAEWNGVTAMGRSIWRTAPIAYVGPGLYSTYCGSDCFVPLTPGKTYIYYVTSSGVYNPVQSVALGLSTGSAYLPGSLYGLSTNGRSPLTGPQAGEAWTYLGGTSATFAAVFNALPDEVAAPGTFISNIPEPGSWALWILGIGAVGAAARSRRGLASAGPAQPLTA